MPIHRLITVTPLLQVGVSVGGSHMKSRRAVNSIAMTGLLDTGATITAARPSAINMLKPRQVGGVEVRRSDGTVELCRTDALQIAFEPDTDVEQRWLQGQ